MRLVTNVHSTSPLGGVELNVFQVSRELARRGHQVHLLYREAGTLVPDYRTFCQSVTKVPDVDYWFPTGRRARPKQMAMMVPAATVAVRHRPDLIYGNRIMSTAWAVPAGRLAGAPVVCHEHGHSDHLSTRQIDRLRRHVDRFVMVSHHVAGLWLASGLDPDRVDVVFNGVDPAEYPFGGDEERSGARHALGLGEDPFVVTYFGRIDREKGVHVLLDAWRRLDFGPDEARLLVMGSATVHADAAAYRAELEELATDTVRFVPGRRDVVTPLHASDVVVVPSVWQEPFGRTVIEALCTGRPVLASRVGGIPEILTGPLGRFLFEPSDAAGLAEQLAGLVHWRDKEPELAQLCRARVLDQFTLAQTVDGLEASFRSAR
jgi:glycosyltransferase involved in cell wall biosynthesis